MFRDVCHKEGATGPHWWGESFADESSLPLVYRGERTSNRIGDLKQHAMTKHGADSIVSERFFTDGYGFYLSIFPEDYSKVITPTMPTSEEARTAMNLMRLWAGVVSNPSRTLQK